jgi:MFS family permease
MRRNAIILAIIVIAQFCCTSLWFASNAVIDAIANAFFLQDSAVGYLTSAVQFGFIIGTLVFAIFTIADRFSPSKVFFICAAIASFFNLLMVMESHSLQTLLLLRALTGFFLAGIYPVGMKIAADYFNKGLGLSLGFLVGALVMGTAFPHLLSDIVPSSQWRLVVYITSIVAISGGLLMLTFVPNGPHRIASKGFDLKAFSKVFRNVPFRAAAFGYFGHMWELYTFWAFVPAILATYNNLNANAEFNIPLWSFIIIAVGGLACIISGLISKKIGVKTTAFRMLLLSGLCCMLSPLMFGLTNPIVFIVFLIFWGFVVIADSPLFSTLIAQNTNPHLKGTALTIVNCIGFSITIISILLMTSMIKFFDNTSIYSILAIGPLFGLWALRKKIVN